MAQLVLWSFLTAACAKTAGPAVPPSSSDPTAVAPLVPPTATPTSTPVNASSRIVGLWTAIDGALHLQFFSDGRFARHFGGREDDPDELSSEHGIYRLGDADRLLIDVPRLGAVYYEYMVGEPWLMLRDPDGRVIRFRRNLGLMETSFGPWKGTRRG